MKFKERLKQLRKSMGLNQDQLADKLKISSSSVSSYERGIREPDFETLEKIADFFEVDQGYLLGDSNIRRKYIFTKDTSYEFQEILDDIMMTDSTEMIEVLNKLRKMNDDELHALNKLLK